MEDYISQLQHMQEFPGDIEVQTFSLDLEVEPPTDLLDPNTQKEQLKLAEMGFYDAAIAGPLCRTWSVALWKEGGPRPYRSRSHPYGLPGLRGWRRRRCEQDFALLEFSIAFLSVLEKRGGTILLEHPADPGRSPFPSIWVLPLVKDLVNRKGMRAITGHQCRWGAISAKPTTLAGNLEDLEDFELYCNHPEGHPVIIGFDEATGAFRSRKAQTYPPDLSEFMARRILKTILKKPPLGGNQTG